MTDNGIEQSLTPANKKIQDLSSQLAENVQQINNVKTDVTNQIQNMNSQVQGFYTTVAALNTAIPSGNTNNYVVTADNYIYRWNGTTWASTGVLWNANGIPYRNIRRPKIANATIGSNQADFFVKSSNLFNKNDVTMGHVIASGTGDLSVNANYLVSNFIEVDPLTQYTTLHPGIITYYDENKTYINNINIDNSTANTFTTPNNCIYVRASILIQFNDTAQINKSATLLTYEEWYMPYIDLNTVDMKTGDIQNRHIQDDSINYAKADFFVKSSNLFNKNDVTMGHVIASGTGDLSVNANYLVSNFIEVDPLTQYTTLHPLRLTFYDKNKVYIGYTNTVANVDSFTFITPFRTSYVRASILIQFNDTAQLNKGVTLLTYENWYTPYIESKNLQDNSIEPVKTNFIYNSSNIIDITNLTERMVINSDGTLISNLQYATSGFIEVKALNNYYFYGFLYVGYYDKNKNFVNRLNIFYDGTALTLPDNVCFIRVSWQPNSNYPNRSINKGNSLLPYEEYYTKFNTELKLKPLNDVIDNSKDRYMIDIPIDGVFSTNETYADYTNFSNTKAADVYAMFDTLMSQYPDYITKTVLGNDSVGNPISVYYFTPQTANATLTTKMPKIFLTCGTHGMEKMSTLSTYLMMKQICEKWDSYSLLEALRFNVKFIIIPIVNPSGWNAFTRQNANGVDINRNFPYNWVSGNVGDSQYGGSAPLSELESQYVKSIFDANSDINIMYDFHNFFDDSNGNYFLWVCTNAGQYTQHMAQNLFSRMTRKWRKEYSFIPSNYFVGYTNPQSVGMIQNYAQSIGIKYTATFEMCWRWVLNSSSVAYDQTTCKTGVEAIVNWLLINLRELTRQQ